MLRTILRKIVKFQTADLTLSFLNGFYADKAKKNDIILVYDGSALKTLLARENLKNIKNERQLEFFLLSSNNCRIGYTEDEAEEILKKFPTRYYLTQDIWTNEGIFLFYSRGIEKIDDIFEILNNKGVHAYRVSIPEIGDIDNTKCYGVNIKHNIHEFVQLIKDGEMQTPKYIDKITDIEINQNTKLCNALGQQYGNGNRKIYIVGPCIAGGWMNPETESLPEILCAKTVSHGMNYTILPIRQIIGQEKENPIILEYDIRKNDIVIFVNTNIKCAEFDTTSLFNSYNGENWLFQGQSPIHTTVTGNRLLADYLIKNIIEPLYIQSDESNDDVVLYDGEPQFTYDMQGDIYKYISRIKETRLVNPDADIGAIVMNCNPFTYGHRYLVEYASNQVDFLYLFIVEEDLSSIPFSDRFFMVYEGVKDIDNVIVVPSGHFIISKITFRNYFEKEANIHDVSAEQDVYIFARYIAKKLNISKRFVGEEPIDHVTNTYNQTMKKILEKHGIRLVEIPRKELDDGEIINATKVRCLLLEEKWDAIKKYVPRSTLNHLKKIKDTVKLRIKKSLNAGYTQNPIKEFVDKVCSIDKVVIYSVGHDTSVLIKYLPTEVVNRLEYCDKSKRIFNGRNVEPPEQLLQKYKDYIVIVTSTKYGAEIYEEFMEMGIEMKRCIFNSILFDD